LQLGCQDPRAAQGPLVLRQIADLVGLKKFPKAK
jgi:hypothetical protein